MVWIAVLVGVALAVAAQIGGRAEWVRRYGPETAREIFRTRLRTIALLCGVFLVFDGATSLLAGGDDLLVSSIVLAGFILGWLAWVFVRRRRLGPALVRMPLSLQNYLLLFCGALNAWAAWLGISAADGWTELPFTSISLAALLTFMGLSPLKLRADGLSSKEVAWRWSQVVHHVWDPDRSHVELHLRSWWWGRTAAVVPVPADARDRIARLLEEHAPAPLPEPRAA